MDPFVMDHQVVPRWGWLEMFVLVLLLSSGLMFLPGTGSLRMVIRGLPYILSLAMLGLYGIRELRGGLVPAGKYLLLAMLLLAIGLTHPGTDPVPGIAQWVFQLSIAAPLFWAPKVVRNRAHLHRLLWLVFFASSVHAVMGVLQAYNPGRFMPPYLELTPSQISMFTFIGPFGFEMIRPPGLTDLPGGAAFGAVITVLLAVGFSFRPRMPLAQRMMCLLFVGIGLFTVYVTQTRSFAITMVGVLVVVAIFGQRYRWGRVIGLGLAGAIAVAVSWIMTAQTAANQGPLARFQDALDDGLWAAFLENRGQFFTRTFTEFLPRYPLGAGVGRWGMMREYFSGRFDPASPPIWVEVQITGWLLDGGVLMWVFYGGALLAAMTVTWRLAWSRQEPDLAFLAALVFFIQMFTIGTTLGGPTFNSYQGMLFWLLTGGLLAAAREAAVARRIEIEQRQTAQSLTTVFPGRLATR